MIDLLQHFAVSALCCYFIAEILLHHMLFLFFALKGRWL